MADNVQEIKSRLNILEVLRDYMQLKPAGSSWKGLCPFHNERTPSFFVSPERQVWHCFGCGEGGDLFAFVMKRDGLDFRETLELLATRAGVVIEQYDPSRMSQKSALYEILERAARWYTALLRSREGEEARIYLASRGITDDVIDRWGIGFAPEAWDRLATELAGTKYRHEDIVASGLVILRPKERSVRNGIPFYDRFRNRIMFPVRDLQGRIVAFGGRVMSGRADNADKAVNAEKHEEPKYINSPETPIYEKGKILFALDRAKHAIRSANVAILVEGYMDAITAHEAGYANVVATSGTALTPHHVEILKRHTDHLALAFDEDPAGRTAVERGIDAALRAGVSVAVLSIPAGKDPDECIRTDRAAWDRAVATTQPFMDYLFDRTIAGRDCTLVDEKKRVAKILLTTIAKIADPVEQTHYLQKLGRLLQVSEEILRTALPKTVASISMTPRASDAKVVERTRVLRASERLLGLLLSRPQFIARVVERVTPDMFPDSRGATLYKALISFYTQYSQCGSSGATVPAASDHDQQDFFSSRTFEDFIRENPDCATYGNELLLRVEQEFPTVTEQVCVREIRDTIMTLRRVTTRVALARITGELGANGGVSDRSTAALTKEFTRLSEELRLLDTEENAS
ncbi:DNA primase [Candidatus Uhrbacteria bacterium]|nr:DNA primase [Candidatus Uhrbacteria bacterium]